MAAVSECGKALHVWYQAKFAQLGKQIYQRQSKISSIYNGDFAGTDFEADELRACQKDLSDLIYFKESLWHQRSKPNWIREGDRNTHFSIQLLLTSANTKLIRKIKHDHGTWHSDPSAIQDVIMGYP